MTLTDLIPNLTRVTAKELHGPCPWCLGKDRFMVWPETDRYWCRQCRRRGDTIQFLRDFHGLSFHAARARVEGRNDSPLPTSHQVRQSLATAVEAEYKAWKTEQWLDKNQQIAEAEGVIQSLEQCARFSLSAKEGQRLADLLSHWYAELDALCQEVDLYSPNPKIDDTRVQEEWIATQKKQNNLLAYLTSSNQVAILPT